MKEAVRLKLEKLLDKLFSWLLGITVAMLLLRLCLAIAGWLEW